MSRLPRILLGAAIALAYLGGGAAQAIPSLQLYIEGATYQGSTWVTDENQFDLWVVGYGDVTDVTLVAAFETGEAGSITLTPTTTSLVADPSTPAAPVALAPGGDGDVPQMIGNKDLPSHGIYGPGTSFLEWDLGDLDAPDSPCGDFQDSFPATLNKVCQINVYSVTVTGYHTVHFDAYGVLKGKPTKAPFSHDAAMVPEPSAAMLFGLGALLVTTRVRRR